MKRCYDQQSSTAAPVRAYRREMDIRNMDAMPRGTGCRYLLCVTGLHSTLTAKRWCRKALVSRGIEVVIDMGK